MKEGEVQMEYIGVDLHKRGFNVCVMNNTGDILFEEKYDNNLKSLENLVSSFPNSSVVMEATQNWMWIVRVLQSKNIPVTLSNPIKTKAIASARIKTDKIDASTLAHLLRANLVPMSYIPTIKEQEARDLARARCQLVKQKTWIKNQIHSLLTKENLPPPTSDLFGKKGQKWLGKQTLTENNQFVLKQYLVLLKETMDKVSAFDQKINEVSRGDRKVEILKSIPGVGTITAFVIASELGEPKRFPNGKKAAAYFGLVPSIYQSGKTKRLGSITKLGNPYARWMLVQASHRLVRSDTNTKLFYQVLSARRGKKKAIVAVARKIVELSWWLLVDNRLYEVRVPRGT